MQIHHISGTHLTATNKRHIAGMVANGWSIAHSKRISYLLEPESDNRARVTISAPETDSAGRRIVRHRKAVIQIGGSVADAKRARAEADDNRRADSDRQRAYADAKAESDRLYTETLAAKRALNAIPGVGAGPMGLTPDDVRATPEYKRAKAQTEAAFKRLRDFNAWFVREFKREFKRDEADN